MPELSFRKKTHGGAVWLGERSGSPGGWSPELVSG